MTHRIDRRRAVAISWNAALALALCAVAWLAAPRASLAQEPDTSCWVTNGPVRAIVQAGQTIYIGGEFTHVGPPTGSFVRLDAATGAVLPPVNRVIGAVYSVCPDGAGGWFLAGDLKYVQGVPRDGLAHLDAAGALTDWNPQVDGLVSVVTRSGGTLYVGGYFTGIDGHPRSSLAAFDVATGAMTGWSPQSNNAVDVLVVDGGTVYACGGFTSMGGLPRNTLAAIDAATGAVTDWNPSPNQRVYALVVHGGRVYVGGNFSTIAGQSRLGVAALDPTTGAANQWDPHSLYPVLCLALSGGTIYAGGYIKEIGGALRHGIAGLDTVSGAATGFDPNVPGIVYSLLAAGGKVYAGGTFTSVGAQPRNGVAELDPATGAATSWNPNANQAVYALAADGGTIGAGGSFTSVGGVVRHKIAAIDAATGVATSWDPDASGNNSPYQEPTMVMSLAVDGGTVYAGGRFDHIGGQARDGIAALDATTGAATSWNPGANSDVRDLRVAGGTVYVAGDFWSIGGETRLGLAAIDPVTGAATSWDPHSDNSVSAIAIRGATVYAGGDFTAIGGQPRSGLGAVDVATGLATSWRPDVGQSPGIYDIVPRGDLVYVAGFWSVLAGGQVRRGIAAFDDQEGVHAGILPERLRERAGYGRRNHRRRRPVDAIGGQPPSRRDRCRERSRHGLNPAAVSTWDTPMDPEVVTSLAVIGDHVYAGGEFRSFGPWPQSCFARFARPGTLDIGRSTVASGPRLAASPNPFSRRSTLSFTLAASADVEVRIHDVGGRLVRTLHGGRVAAGSHRLEWDGRDGEGHPLPQGVYLATMATVALHQATRIVKLR